MIQNIGFAVIVSWTAFWWDRLRDKVSNIWSMELQVLTFGYFLPKKVCLYIALVLETHEYAAVKIMIPNYFAKPSIWT